MITALQIADAIGRRKLAGALGLGPTAVSNAVVRGWFPATWFVVVSGLAAKVGTDCPPCLFKMKPLDESQSVDSISVCQETIGNNQPTGAAT